MKKNEIIHSMWSSNLSIVTDDMNPQGSTKAGHAKMVYLSNEPENLTFIQSSGTCWGNLMGGKHLSRVSIIAETSWEGKKNKTCKDVKNNFLMSFSEAVSATARTFVDNWSTEKLAQCVGKGVQIVSQTSSSSKTKPETHIVDLENVGLRETRVQPQSGNTDLFVPSLYFTDEGNKV